MGSCLSGDGASAPIPYAPVSTSSVDKRKNSKKRLTTRRDSSSSDSRMEIWLHRVPGRMFLNGSTDVASLFSKQGKKGINQDSMIFWENFGSKADTIFCGVFDGHGPYGHMVSKKVRDSLPLKLSAQWELNRSKDGSSDISGRAMGRIKSGVTALSSVNGEQRNSYDQDHKDNGNDIFMTLKESFLKAFKVMDKELKLHPSIDCFCSGTTAVTLIKQDQDIVIGNVGDSRAVLGTRDKDDSLIAVQLTVDFKPNLPREAERIGLCKGRVFPLKNEPEVARLWLPNSDSPGLAMSRAFGDFCLKDYGLISVPEVSYHRVTKKDEFVVLATDGIWDVLSNEEVVEIVASVAQPRAARALVESAIQAWRFKYPFAKVDDCAVVCLFLGSGLSNHFTSALPEEQTEDNDSKRKDVSESVGSDLSGTILGPI